MYVDDIEQRRRRRGVAPGVAPGGHRTCGQQPTAPAAFGGAAHRRCCGQRPRLAESLAVDPDRDVVVHLAPGVHRVPSSGLAPTAAHSPSAGRTVRWLGRGAASVSSAVPVTGWALANEPGLPAGAMAAPSPLQDGGVRHLWVGGRRAACTRVAAALALPGGLNLIADGSGCSCSAAAAAAAAGWANPGEVQPGGPAERAAGAALARSQ